MTMNKLLHPRILVAAYIVAAVITFGHSAAETTAAENAKYAACRADRAEGFCFRTDEKAPVGAFMAAMWWPLYWSWEAFS